MLSQRRNDRTNLIDGMLPTGEYELVLFRGDAAHPIEHKHIASKVLSIDSRILLDIDMSYDNNHKQARL
jgi:hypothetical protein